MVLYYLIWEVVGVYVMVEFVVLCSGEVVSLCVVSLDNFVFDDFVVKMVK